MERTCERLFAKTGTTLKIRSPLLLKVFPLLVSKMYLIKQLPKTQGQCERNL